MAYSELFDEVFELTVALEGERYENDPDDPGGETKYGICKREFPYLDIKNLTKEQAKEIYHTYYWKPLNVENLISPKVAAEIFDTGVNCGQGTAVKIAQRACNALGSTLVVDGYMGKLTTTKLNEYSEKYQKILLTTLNALQCAKYVELTELNPKLKKYFRGWVGKRVVL